MRNRQIPVDVHATHAMDWITHEAEFGLQRAYDQDDLEVRRRVYMKGMSGLRDISAKVGGNPLLRISEPQEVGSGWQVTVLGVQAVNFPPITLVTTFAPPANVPALQLPRATVSLPGFSGVAKLRLEFGTGNTFDVAWMDYPVQGSTFEVYSADVRLFLDQLPTNVPSSGPNFTGATIGAFITKGTRSKDLLLPTFTQAAQLATVGGPAAFFVPPRAIGYRLLTPTAGVADYGPTGPTNIAVPQTAGTVTLARGAGQLVSVVVTAVGTTNLTFTDSSTGNVIAVIPSTATVGQVFFINAGFGGPGASGGLLQANKSTTTPAVTVTVAPWPGQASTITYSCAQCDYTGGVIQRDTTQMSPFNESGLQAGAQGNMWAPLNPATQMVLATPNDPSNAQTLQVQFILDLA